MRKGLVVFLSIIVVLVCGTSQQARAATTYPLQLQNPTVPPFSTNVPVNCSRGWRFQVNDPGFEVTQLGVNSPISSTVSQTVTLFDVATQAVLAQVTTTPGPGWVFVDLSTPVALTQGSQYIVSAHFPSPGGYYYGNRSGIGDSWFPTGTIQYLDMRFANDSGPSVFPTNILANQQYGVPDIGYEIAGAVVPVPGALLIGSFGAGFVGWLRRRGTI